MKIILVFIICLFFQISFYCQTTNSKHSKWTDIEKIQMEKGELLFNENKFKLASPIFEELYVNHSNDLYLKYLYAASALSISGKQAFSLNLLKELKEKKRKDIEVEFYYAKAHFLNCNFEEATTAINYYFSKLKHPTTEQKKKYHELVNYCTNALQLIKNPVSVKIENMGNIINTEGAEYYPNISGDESLIVFTYKGLKSKGGRQDPFNRPNKSGIYYEDVFLSTKENGKWKAPVVIKSINTVNNESSLSLSNDGKKLLINMDSDQDDGDIYLCNFEKGAWSFPVKLSGGINTPFWENDGSLTADFKTLYYASSKPGGFGGKDIYKSHLLPNGLWSVGQNLGNEINTPQDEDSPFIHYDGKLLLFSSKGHNSMGGYDIFKTRNISDSSWTTPENIGFPINTPDDDIHYVLSDNGEIGYYSLGKPDGYGDLDIYKVEPGITGEKPAVFVIKGTVMLDDSAAQAEITVEVPSDNSVFNTLKSSALTGSYCVTLPVGEDYKISWKINELPVQSKMINASKTTSYLLEFMNINFLSKNDMSTVVDSTISAKASTLNPYTDSLIPDFSAIKGKSLNEPAVYRKLLDLGGNLREDGLEFKVQIAAYKHPENFRYEHLKQFGIPEAVKYGDGITRFTQLSFSTINEAELSRQKIINCGQKDAWITAFRHGERITLEELILQNFNSKPVN